MLVPCKKNYDQLRQHIKKQRHYSANKTPSNQSYGSSRGHVQVWELDYKTMECRIDAFELWCWRRFLKVHWASRRSNLSILKSFSPEYSLGGLILKQKLQYFGHQKWEELAPWCWESLMVLEGNDRGWDGSLASLTQWTWVWLSSGSWWWTEREAWHPDVCGFAKIQTRLSDWTDWEPRKNLMGGNKK